MSGQYVLGDDGKTPIPAPDLRAWARWFEGADRVVANGEIAGVRVSTVFLGLDHSFGGGPPLVFETMVFGGDHDGNQDRYSTWTEAEAGHAKMLAKIHGPKAS